MTQDHDTTSNPRSGAPELSAELSDEQFASEMLAQLEPVQPSQLLERRVAEIPLRHQKERSSFWPFEKVFQPVLGLLGAAALGLVVGAQDGWLGLGEDTPEAEAAALSQSAAAEETGSGETASEGTGSGEPSGARSAELSEPELSELEEEFLLAFGEQWDDQQWLDMETL